MAKQIVKTATASKVLKFKFLNATNFSEFLKKFMVVDSNALLELRKDNTLVIKSYTAARTAVKYGVLKLEDVFDFDPDEDSIEENIILGIYNIEKLIKTIAMYSANDDIEISLNYDVDSDGEYVAKTMTLNNSIMEITFNCAQKTLFKHMPDDIIKSVFNSEKYGFSFQLDTATLKNIEGASSLEAGTDVQMKIYGEDENDYYLEFSGKNFKYKHTGNVVVNNSNDPTVITKEYLKYLDKETYTCYTTDTALLLFSDDSETKISFGRVLVNDDE